MKTTISSPTYPPTFLLMSFQHTDHRAHTSHNDVASSRDLLIVNLEYGRYKFLSGEVAVAKTVEYRVCAVIQDDALVTKAFVLSIVICVIESAVVATTSAASSFE